MREKICNKKRMNECSNKKQRSANLFCCKSTYKRTMHSLTYPYNSFKLYHSLLYAHCHTLNDEYLTSLYYYFFISRVSSIQRFKHLASTTSECINHVAVKKQAHLRVRQMLTLASLLCGESIKRMILTNPHSILLPFLLW